ncbi:MAG: hypothetical protein Q8O98_01330 [bacterium]|nr:hypothetical protein [bacterium]
MQYLKGLRGLTREQDLRLRGGVQMSFDRLTARRRRLVREQEDLKRELAARGMDLGIQVKNVGERRDRTYYIAGLNFQEGEATLRSCNHYRGYGEVVFSPRLDTLLKKFVVVSPAPEPA